MSSTDNSAVDHAYFQAIEKAFIRLRGAPLLLSPADWQQARQWRREGIPLELVLQTLEQVFAQRTARGAKGRVQGLRYCAAALAAAWQEQGELQSTGKRESAPAMDVRERLEALAQAVSSVETAPAGTADRIRDLVGSPEEVETALIDLDRELVDLALTHLDGASREDLQRSIRESLDKLRSRLGGEEVTRVRERLFRESVRRHAGLPVLSLFAVDVGEG